MEIIPNRGGRCKFMEIKRDYYLQKLIRKKDNGFIKIITDIRRKENLICLIICFIII